jgi:cytochrome c
MKRIVMIAVAAAGLCSMGAAEAQEALAKSNGCLNCHAITTKKVGPSFKDTAAKYKGKPEAEAMLVAKLAEGKAHPAVKANAADTKTLVQWILSM